MKILNVIAVIQLFAETAEILKQMIWSFFPGLNFNNTCIYFKIPDQGKSKTFEVSDDNNSETEIRE